MKLYLVQINRTHARAHPIRVPDGEERVCRRGFYYTVRLQRRRRRLYLKLYFAL